MVAVETQTNNVETFCVVLIIKCLHLGHFTHTRSTPTSPKINQHIIASTYIFGKLMLNTSSIGQLYISEHHAWLLTFPAFNTRAQTLEHSHIHKSSIRIGISNDVCLVHIVVMRTDEISRENGLHILITYLFQISSHARDGFLISTFKLLLHRFGHFFPFSLILVHFS